jgi:copper(I)-binding protein
MGLARYSSAATDIQIYNGGGVSKFNSGDAHAMLYGVKRTTA